MGRPAGEKRDAVGASAFVGNEKAGAGAVGCVDRPLRWLAAKVDPFFIQILGNVYAMGTRASRLL